MCVCKMIVAKICRAIKRFNCHWCMRWKALFQYRLTLKLGDPSAVSGRHDLCVRSVTQNKRAFTATHSGLALANLHQCLPTWLTWSGEPALFWDVPLTSWSRRRNKLSLLVNDKHRDNAEQLRQWQATSPVRVKEVLASCSHQRRSSYATDPVHSQHLTSALCTQYNNALFLCVKASSHCAILQGIQGYVQY